MGELVALDTDDQKLCDDFTRPEDIIQTENIQPITTNAFPQAVRRPGNSRLNTRKIEHTFDLTLLLWQTGVMRMLTEIFEKRL